MRQLLLSLCLGGVLASAFACGTAWGNDPCDPCGPAGPYVWGKAYHVLASTHNEESGYFSLCEGKEGKIYVGTAKYGVNSFLVEFDPLTETQRIVINTNAACGLDPQSYNAAQSKMHTRNYVGESGKVYVGTMEAPQVPWDPNVYPGGYTLTYDPISDTTECLGMPLARWSVTDVRADEARDLLYVVLLEGNQPWRVQDMSTGAYTELGALLTDFGRTLIDQRGYASVITTDFQLAQYNPNTGQVTVRDIVADGETLSNVYVPHWQIGKDGRTAYLIQMQDPTLYAIDLLSPGSVVNAVNHGLMLQGNNYDSRSSLDVGPDGKVYAVIRVDNDTGFGGYYLWHLTRFDTATEVMEDLGILAVENPQFFFDDPCAVPGHPATNEEHPPYYGYHMLPDGVLTPLYSVLATIVASDGSIYLTVLYPFTLFKIDGIASSPSTYYVNSNAAGPGHDGLTWETAYVTVQEALDDPNVLHGDEILVAAGTYRENISFGGKNVTVRSIDADDPVVVAATAINGGGSGPVVTFAGTESVACALQGLTITGGDNAADGGGIVGNGCQATIKQCVIRDNSSSQGGGGIADCDGPIEECLISGNSAATAGGGLRQCDGTINRCIVRGNTATNSGGGFAGCNGEIINCLIINNTSSVGGGLNNCDGEIRNCTVVENTATQGAGLRRCDAPISHCILWDNHDDPFFEGFAPSYTCYPGGYSSNIDSDPCFVDATGGDYHLRWSSACIDRGNPGYEVGYDERDTDGEPRKMNGTLDLGFDEVGHKQADFTRDGIIQLDDLLVMAAFWLSDAGSQAWYPLCDLDGDTKIDMADWSAFGKDWQWQADWYGP